MSNKRIEKAKNNVKKKEERKKATSKPKKTRKPKVGRIIKVLFILFFTGCIIGLFAVGSFFGYIIVKSPEFRPEDLYDKQPSVLLARDGTEFARIGSEIRDIVSYDQLPEVLVDAIVATEDSRFFQHNGFDFPRFMKASFGQVIGHSDAGGASTLTMQISKNKLTSTEDEGVAGIIRKFTDIYLSVFKIEKTYTKQEIIEFYVNSNYLGADTNGVEDASKAYFRKSVKDLNLSEAATLAGLFNAPGFYDPYVNPEGCESRRQTVLYLMKRHGYINDEEYEVAKRMTVDKIVQPQQEKKTQEYQGFINTVVEDVIKKTGNNPYDIAMKIYTTMDMSQQKHMEMLMNGELDYYKWENDKVQGGIAVVSAKDGSVTAVGAGRNRKARDYNYATDIKVQIGSTAKPLYDYSLGVEKLGWGTGTVFIDEPWGYKNGTLKVNNWSKSYQGMVTIRQALVDSINMTAIKAFQSTSEQDKINWVESMGLHPELENGSLHEAHALGGYTGENPLSMAAAYNTFATGGYYIEPYTYTKIEFLATDTEPIEYKYTMKRVMSPETAYIMTNLLVSVAKETGFSWYDVNGVTYASKSGTTNYTDQTLEIWHLPDTAVPDLWAVGYTDKYTIAAWRGYDEISSEFYNVFGSGENYKLFCAAAKGVFKEQSNFVKPEGVVAVTLERGLAQPMLPSPYTPDALKITEYFKRGTEPTAVSDRYDKLANITGLKASKSSDNKEVTLTWKKIATPNPISLEYLTNYFHSIYHDEARAQRDIDDHYGYYSRILGKVVYEIYEKDSNGDLVLVDTTTEDSITLTPTTADVSYVVKTSYSIFKANRSDGVTISISGIDVPILDDDEGKEDTTDDKPVATPGN